MDPAVHLALFWEESEALNFKSLFMHKKKELDWVSHTFSLYPHCMGEFNFGTNFCLCYRHGLDAADVTSFLMNLKKKYLGFALINLKQCQVVCNCNATFMYVCVHPGTKLLSFFVAIRDRENDGVFERH